MIKRSCTCEECVNYTQIDQTKIPSSEEPTQSQPNSFCTACYSYGMRRISQGVCTCFNCGVVTPLDLINQTKIQSPEKQEQANLEHPSKCYHPHHDDSCGCTDKPAPSINKNICMEIEMEIGTNVKLKYDIPKELRTQLGATGKLVLVKPEKVKLPFGTWFTFENFTCSGRSMMRICDPNEYDEQPPARPDRITQVKTILRSGTVVNFGISEYTIQQDLEVYIPKNTKVQLPAGVIYQMLLVNIPGENYCVLEFKKPCNVYLYANGIDSK